LPQLSGSCHCGAVRFSVFSRAAVPFMRCYCSICRKTAGGGGYAINLSGDYATLKVEGEENVSVYHARGPAGDPEGVSPAKRHFCRHCGSALFLYDARWPELVRRIRPRASAGTASAHERRDAAKFEGQGTGNSLRGKRLRCRCG
jgi:hypothetical protein